MDINKDILMPYLIFDKPVRYTEAIELYPVKMMNILEFQLYSKALTIRKDSIFNSKNILKMTYYDFIKYTHNNIELAIEYDMDWLPSLYTYLINLLGLVCPNSEIKYNLKTFDLTINEEILDSEKFDDIRKIIIAQNDIDFNIDEFINRDTLEALEKARKFEEKKKSEESDIEDYIDSLVVGLNVTEEYISNMSIRKFWRYIKRINKRVDYEILKTAEYSGMVTLKTDVKHWMSSLVVEDKYEDLKSNEQELRDKIG